MSVCPLCGNTGLRPVERGPAGATYTVLGRCSCQTPTVTIPRAQHEALMAAAKVFLLSRIRSAKIDAALAALRAVGIQGE